MLVLVPVYNKKARQCVTIPLYVIVMLLGFVALSINYNQLYVTYINIYTYMFCHQAFLCCLSWQIT